MSGIYLVIIFLVWLFLLSGIVIPVTYVLPKRWWRAPAGVLLIVVLLPLPLADEIVAKPKFEQLCREKAEVIVDTPNTQGRTIWFEDAQQTTIDLGGVRVVQSRRRFVDVKTKELVYHYFRLEAVGGWLVRSFGISEGKVPLLFHVTCQPKSLETFNAKLGVTRINRPISNTRGLK